MKRLIFLNEYLKNPKSVGAIVRSSRFLIRGFLKEIDFKKAQMIVEFGAGDGQITKALLEKMPPNGKLVAFEIHPLFITDLRKIEDRRLTVISCPAEKAQEELEKLGISKIDAVVSSVPIAPMKVGELKNFFENIKDLIGETGAYLQYTYTPNHHALFLKNFRDVKIKFILFNIPPAFIYICKNNLK
jgi:phospholipid N-methyltransferase